MCNCNCNVRHLDDVNRVPLTAPKVEQATKKGMMKAKLPYNLAIERREISKSSWCGNYYNNRVDL